MIFSVLGGTLLWRKIEKNSRHFIKCLQNAEEGHGINMRNRTYTNVGRKKSHTVAVILLLLFLGSIAWFFIFFRVQHVEVAGSTHYSDEQVKDIVLRGPAAGNSVLAFLFCSRKNTGEISFIDAVEVDYVEPDTILINVEEKQSIGCVRYLDCYVYFDREGTAIESAVERDADIPCYAGIEPGYVCLNQPMQFADREFLHVAVSLFQIFNENVQAPDSIYVEKRLQITLAYGDIQVNLGKDEYLDDKISRMAAILPQLAGRKGILHLEDVTSEKKNITFEDTNGI